MLCVQNTLNLAIELDGKKISEKIKKEPLFITIMTKIAIPFNLEEKESNLSGKEKLAKEHLENTSDITMNMGYVNTNKKNGKNKDDKEGKNERVNM